jgi:hypothetical protein
VGKVRLYPSTWRGRDTRARAHRMDRMFVLGTGSSEFGYCRYNMVNLDPSQPSDQDPAAQI